MDPHDRSESEAEALLADLGSPAGLAAVIRGEVAGRLLRLPAPAVRRVLARRILGAVDAAWERGWQPADLHRYAARRADQHDPGLLAAALAEDAARYADLGHRVAPAWMAQLDAVGVSPGRRGQTQAWLADQPDDRAVAGALGLLLVLGGLFLLPRLTDPPSAWAEGATACRSDVSAGLLARIRALLAKAESTTFDAEAEAFMAKAQELMTRHRIDRALLADGEPQARLADGVVGRRIAVDDPYATAKFHLLAGIAEVNAARAVWSKALGMATVMGFPVEVEIVEELFTSLLVQATAAMRREGSKVDPWGRSRTKAFRRSFLLAFGDRIAARLREAADLVVEEAAAATGTDLVPVLAARDEAVTTRLEAAFPSLGSLRVAVSDAEGVFAGRLAGDRADLGAGPRLDRSA